MKSIFKKAMAVMLLMSLCIGVIGMQPAQKTEAATKMTRSQFIIATVKAMSGKKNAAGKTIEYKLNSDGSVSYAGKTITADTVKTLKSKYSVTTESAQYLAIAKDMGLFSVTSASYKSATKMKAYTTYKLALTVLVKADKYLNGTTFTSSQIKTLKKRISNISKAGSSTYQSYMAKAYALGLYVGTKDGDYTTTRTFKFSTKPSKTTCEKLIARLTDTSKRYVLTDDYMVTRTTKLPKTADLYPHILDSFPNTYYDTAWNHCNLYQNGTVGSKETCLYTLERKRTVEDRILNGGWIWPCDMEKFINAGDNECAIASRYRVKASLDKVYDETIEFYTYAMNVNYKSIKNDTKWRKVMSKYLSDEYIDKYIENCIKNKTIVECDRVAIDKGSLYFFEHSYFYKVYLHFRVVSDIPVEKGVWDEADGDIIPCKLDASFAENESRAYIIVAQNLKLGEWTDYYTNAEALNGKTLGAALDYQNMVSYFGLYPDLYY